MRKFAMTKAENRDFYNLKTEITALKAVVNRKE